MHGALINIYLYSSGKIMMFQFGTCVSIRCPCGCKSTTSQYILWTEGWLRSLQSYRYNEQISVGIWAYPYLCAVVVSSHWSKGSGRDLGIFQIQKNTKHLLPVWMFKSLQQGLWSLDWKWGLPNCGRSRIWSMDSSLSSPTYMFRNSEVRVPVSTRQL